MSKIARYQGNVRAFASNAQGMERTVFGGTNQADDLTSQITASFLRGWGIVGASEHPSLEDFNAAMYSMSQFIAYQHQMGVPEWHVEQEYHLGSICTHNGESYQSLQNANVGSQPPSAKWTPVLTSKNGLANLGLGAGAPAVGIPFFWPHTQMPNNLVDDWNQMTFLKMNGSSFTAAAYPVLAKIWPGLVLPDFRGEFIRIWDDGRGIDSGRNLLTAQSFAMQNITGSFGEIADESKQYAVEINAASGAFQAQTYMRNIMRNPDFASRDAAVSITFDASRVAQTAAETRPRNISIGFIVRAK